MRNVTIEIITTGEELLSGTTQDTNFFWFAKEVFSYGFKVNYQQCIGDSLDDIANALRIANDRSDYVLITGGLGPTSDDLTREAASLYFDEELILNKKEEINIRNLFKNRKRRYSKLNQKQALFPKGAQIVSNSSGTAPGFTLIQKGSKNYFFPGVPREFKEMVKKTFFIDLKKEQKKSTKVVSSKMLKVFGLSESEVAEKIQRFGSKKSYIGYRPHKYEIHIRLISSSDKISSAKKDNKLLEMKIRKVIGNYIYSDSETSLAAEVVKLLLKKKLFISTAESCTGGLLGNMITNVPGSSACFHYGFITYGNNAKEKILGVNSLTISKYGAVSRQCVKEMVVKSRKISGSNIALAVSGIAGPTGGSKDKPVGTVFIGVSYKDKTTVKKYFFPGSREMFKLRTSLSCLDIVRRIISFKSN